MNREERYKYVRSQQGSTTVLSFPRSCVVTMMAAWKEGSCTPPAVKKETGKSISYRPNWDSSQLDGAKATSRSGARLGHTSFDWSHNIKIYVSQNAQRSSCVLQKGGLWRMMRALHSRRWFRHVRADTIWRSALKHGKDGWKKKKAWRREVDFNIYFNCLILQVI